MLHYTEFVRRKGQKVMKGKFSAKFTFSQLQSRFGRELKPAPAQIRFSEDVKAFVQKIDQARAATRNSTLVFKRHHA